MRDTVAVEVAEVELERQSVGVILCDAVDDGVRLPDTVLEAHPDTLRVRVAMVDALGEPVIVAVRHCEEVEDGQAEDEGVGEGF